MAGLDENYNRIFAVNAAANIRLRARALGRELDPSGFERVTWAMVELAGRISGPDYVQMLNRLHGISREIAVFFETYDVLLTPTLAEPPVELGVLDMMSEDLEAYSERLWRFTPFTYPFNVTGQPAMSVPLAWNEQRAADRRPFRRPLRRRGRPAPARRPARAGAPLGRSPAARARLSPRTDVKWPALLCAALLAAGSLASCASHVHTPFLPDDAGTRPALLGVGLSEFDYADHWPHPTLGPTTGEDADYRTKSLALPSVGRNGQPGNLVTARHHQGKREGAKPLVVVLPIWGFHDDPSNTLSAGLLERGAGAVEVADA